MDLVQRQDVVVGSIVSATNFPDECFYGDSVEGIVSWNGIHWSTPVNSPWADGTDGVYFRGILRDVHGK